MDGKTLLHYEIGEEIGAGGMGTVYRARDTTLERDVAVKVLPDHLVEDTERMARFEREAKLLASLNHAHIATVHGFEKDGGTRFLVMELVEGPTLAEKIGVGALPMEEALVIAKQVTEGLEAAHEKGIVHRDLKPANIKLTDSGDVKILDFGLAKAIEGEAPTPEDSNSPTLTRAATQAGVLLGTAAYMSPEQARGQAVDRRTDIWAFGVVLFEMLTGGRLFSGDTVSDTLAAVLRANIDWNALPVSTPTSLRRLLRRCLERDRKKRLGFAGDARLEIDDALIEPDKIASPSRPSRGHRMVTTISAVVATLALAALWLSPEPPTTKEVYRLNVAMPEGLDTRVSGVAFSPNGNELVYVGDVNPNTQIFLRSLDSLEARPIPGTEGGNRPFFSPDGEWIVFHDGASDQTKKASLRESHPVTTLATPEAFGAGSWTESGFVYYGRLLLQEIRRVPSSGGTPEVVADLSGNAGNLRCVEVLPGEAAVLATIGGNVRLVHIQDGSNEVFLENALCPRYASSGHLVFGRGDKLFAVAFDTEALTMTGSPVPVLEGVDMTRGAATTTDHPLQFAFSQTGHLFYVPRLSRDIQIVRVDRAGNTEPLLETAGQYGAPAVSPDGDAIAVQDATSDLWILEWERDVMRRVTFDPGSESRPIWTPDGEHLTYFSVQDGSPSFEWIPSDGSGEREVLLELGNVSIGQTSPSDWSPDGSVLAVMMRNTGNVATQTDVMALRPDASGSGAAPSASPLVETTFSDLNARFSPDGRWLAYESGMPGGRREVYVQPFPGTGGRFQVSTGGGNEPRWSARGDELFYRNGNAVLAVSYTAEGDAFEHDAPRELFRGNFFTQSFTYDVFPDGEHFVMLQPADGGSAAPTEGVVILNWFEELERLVPTE